MLLGMMSEGIQDQQLKASSFSPKSKSMCRFSFGGDGQTVSVAMMSFLVIKSFDMPSYRFDCRSAAVPCPRKIEAHLVLVPYLRSPLAFAFLLRRYTE